MHKYFIFLAISIGMLSGCGQDSYQANILNTKSTNLDVTVPKQQATETFIDDDSFFANEKKTIVAHMHELLSGLEKNPSTDNISALLDDVQKLLMTNPYEKNWQNQTDKLKQQILQLEEAIQNKADVQPAIKTIEATLSELS